MNTNTTKLYNLMEMLFTDCDNNDIDGNIAFFSYTYDYNKLEDISKFFETFGISKTDYKDDAIYCFDISIDFYSELKKFFFETNIKAEVRYGIYANNKTKFKAGAYNSETKTINVSFTLYSYLSNNFNFLTDEEMGIRYEQLINILMQTI